jgi:hypothetical protein
MKKFSFTISAHIGNHVAIRYFCFNDIYPSCIHKKSTSSHWLYSSSSSTLLSPTTHCLPGTMMYFFSSLDQACKTLVQRLQREPKFIFMTHICQVNDCEPIIITPNTLWMLHPLTFKYRDLYRYFIIQFHISSM